MLGLSGRISNRVYLQEKPASFVVRNGGWVIYASPNWKGKAMYCFDGKYISFA